MLFSPCVGLSSALKGGIASASATVFFLLVLLVAFVAIVLIKWHSKKKEGVLICIHTLTGSLVLAYFICVSLKKLVRLGIVIVWVITGAHCLFEYTKFFIGSLLPSSVVIVVSAYCSSSRASEVSTALAGRNNIMTSASCSWWRHCACMQMEYLCQWLNENATSAKHSHWHPPPMHKVQGLSKEMCSHTSCIDCCCIVQCWSWSGWWKWWL